MVTKIHLLCGILYVSCVAIAGPLWAADPPTDDVVGMVVNLIHDKDKDVRAVGLEQVREEAKGAEATKRFAAELPKLEPDAQVGLLAALADRGDTVARPAVLDMLKSRETPVLAAAIRALGPLGQSADVPELVRALDTNAGPLKTAAHAALVRLQGPGVSAAIAAQLGHGKSDLRTELIAVIADRRESASIPSLLAAVDGTDRDVRAAALTALGELAGPENVADLAARVLKAHEGPQREEAERAVMLACSRDDDVDRRAEPLLAVMAKSSAADQRALLSTLGRVGGKPALKVIEAALADKDPAEREAGMRALCNWPDGSIAARLYDLARTAPEPAFKTMALAALIRVAPLPDKRSDKVRLDGLKRAMELATKVEDRKTIIKRARAIRTLDAFHFVLPYLDQEAYAQSACETVVELAHHKQLRQPHEAEFAKALDRVIAISKDPKVVDLAQRYKKGQTAPPPVAK